MSNRSAADRDASTAMRPAMPGAGTRVLVIGGEDHDLRVPFLLELRKRGFDVAAAGTGDACAFARHGITYFLYRFDRLINPLADWRALKSLEGIICAYRPHVVQSFDTKPAILAPLAASRTGSARVVRTINGLGWVFSSKSMTARALRPVFDLLHRATAPQTSLTVFQNRSDQAYFERARLIGPGGSRLIPGSGVDPDRFAAMLASGLSPQELRNTLGLGDSEVVITVARLSRSKGITTLLEAAALVHEKRPGVRFLLVGSGEKEGKHAVTQAEIGRHAPYVMAIGQRSEVPSLLRLSNVFAFPSELFEGVPRVLLEAALAGTPIVTTDMPGCVDVVEDRASGFVVPPRDPRQLADRILSLLEDPRTARLMAERARAHVQREFNLALTADRYAEAYLELATTDVSRAREAAAA